MQTGDHLISRVRDLPITGSISGITKSSITPVTRPAKSPGKWC